MGRQALARIMMLAISIGGLCAGLLWKEVASSNHTDTFSATCQRIQGAANVAARLFIFHVSSLKEDYHVWKVYLHSLDCTDAVDGR
jgi:hypothetical protein